MKKIIGFMVAAFFIAAPALAQTDAFLQTLKKIPGITIVNEITPAPVAGYRVFNLTITQLADHKNPQSDTFQQRLVLWHINETGPMILQTSGYNIFGVALEALASTFNANQIQVEHRFFDPSTPTSRDWSLDTIEQSANDFHVITQAFKPIYTGKWAGTGRSKGGMTSVYHRSFFPYDLDATVAHVAPMSYSDNYLPFAAYVSNLIGGDQNVACRQKLLDDQKILLQNKDKIKAKIATTLPNDTFTALAGPIAAGSDQNVDGEDVSIEHAIIELPFTFWQYSGPGADCSNVPAANASVDDHIAFLFDKNSPDGYSDQQLAGFAPYYYQAATQLGSPAATLKVLSPFLQYPGTYTVDRYAPKGSNAQYDNAEAMTEVNYWLRSESERMLFVYGEWDAWSGGTFQPRTDPSADSYLYFVPQGNHDSQFIDLQGDTKTLVYQKLSTWLNATPVNGGPNPRAFFGPTLGDLEFEWQKVHHFHGP